MGIVDTPQTYICLKNELGSLEIDLITFREKGQQVRYLSLNFAGINTKTNAEQEASINLDETTFNQLKTFFKELDWNS